MKNCSLIRIFVLSIFLLCFFTSRALAYIGPGVGISAIGAFCAVITGSIVLILGFIWYPIRRLMRKRKKSNNDTLDGKRE
ncbi:MAG: hypothetical protein PHV48_03955 [Candidatus Omnitrophica bacterium]|nr:hypothetical protein [Candidatus Omnitrophota bacterium]